MTMDNGILASHERLSALLDGEVEAADAAEACRNWHADAEHRHAWHAWHVAGDVMRSDELAVRAECDAAFLAAIRVRLASEPIVLAPAPLPASTFAARRRRARWAVPTAAAAGFVLVAGTFVALRPGGTVDVGPGSAVTARSAPTAGAAEPRLASTGTGDLRANAAGNGRLVRDAQLDRYLAAHKQFAGSTAPGWSQATLRNATVEVEGR